MRQDPARCWHEVKRPKYLAKDREPPDTPVCPFEPQFQAPLRVDWES